MDFLTYNLEILKQTVDVELIPDNVKGKLAAGKIEIYNSGQKKNTLGIAAEFTVLFTDLSRRIMVIYDYGYCLKFDEITIHKYTEQESRNAEIKRLYSDYHLSQVFLASVFNVSQLTISIILKRN